VAPMSEPPSVFGRLASGDPEALAAIYDLHGARLYAHALWLVGRPQDAEDIVQNVFVKLAALPPARLLSVSNPTAYLHAMLRREGLDCLRRRRRAGEPLESLALDPVSGAARTDGIDLARALARLAASQREAVYLHIHAGLSFREVGAVQGVSVHTAASRYRLALAWLRKELDR